MTLRKSLTSWGIYLSTILMMVAGSASAYADSTACPSTMSQADCSAIYGNWTEWDPSGGPSSACYSGDTATLIGNDNAHKIYNYFVGKGYKPAWAAGIVGNIFVESGFNPEIDQTDEKSHAYPLQPDNTKIGWGIVQWTPARKILNYATSVNQPPNSLATQLDFLYKQLEGISPSNSEKGAGDKLKQTTTARDAAVSFLQYYERAADHSPTGKNAQVRGDYAEQFLASINGGAPISNTGGDGASSDTDCSGSINCATSNSTNTAASQTRQDVVCLAQQELAAWTPPGPIPRMQYLKYSQNVPEEWCADFVSWLYEQAHYPLQPDPNWRVPAVVSIRSIGQQDKNFHYHALVKVDSSDDASYDPNYVPKPGDMAIHLLHGSSHVNLVISVSGTTVTMIGGDQGSGPYGGTNSASVVSTEIAHGFTDMNISGYVSPD